MFIKYRNRIYFLNKELVDLYFIEKKNVYFFCIFKYVICLNKFKKIVVYLYDIKELTKNWFYIGIFINL